MAGFNISYIAMICALFPLGIFILSSINIKVTQVSSYLDEIRSSLNDYPLSEFEYLSYCGNKYNNYIFNMRLILRNVQRIKLIMVVKIYIVFNLEICLIGEKECFVLKNMMFRN